ncbi:hypothetical protein R5W24_005070 [Gemmata sp. JC717]|uniref:hypothetical protein n=1 Tax=Gemmata algarum TaxID=2975278 RepID=UPI0021BA436A|nr:hypothetical protein [Gemmata algarum]MDY3555924.1 hypothetical protein [Gemmata algarum]
MTETEWLGCADPTSMVRHLQRFRSSDRKFRLFAAACCRRIAHRLPDDRCREALDTSERYLEGLAGSDELAAAYVNAQRAFTEFDNRDGWETAASAVSSACVADEVPFFAASAAREAALLVWPRLQRKMEYRWQSRVLHDIFGNPFRSVVIVPTWITTDVCILAEGIYAEKAFDRMPILADALQDAGCDNDDILNHCRQPGEHVRGCWVVDLLLGKT